MKKYAVIVAGGSGTRMGGGIPKQFRSLCGRPVLWWSMKKFMEEDPDTQLIVVLPQEFLSLWTDFYSTLPKEERFPQRLTGGGKSRGESVKNGLALIEEEDSLVAIHDGARPFLTKEMISLGWEKALEHGVAVPVVAVTDSLRIVEGEESRSVDRSWYRSVQTPQVFKTSLLKEAYLKAGDHLFTDDASVVEHEGHKVALFEGSPDNIKITNPKDLAIAAAILGKDV